MQKKTAQRSASTARKNIGKPQVPRLLKIHDYLNRSYRNGDRVNCRILGEICGMSPKTIQRDVNYMRDTLDLPIEYDYTDKSFVYTHEVLNFPLGHNLSYEERVALVVASKTLNVFFGMGFGEELTSAFQKITGGLLIDGEDLQSESLDVYFSVRTPGAGIVRDQKLFNAVRRALLNHQDLHVEYQAKGRPAFTERRLHPYHLACVENRWILVALDVEKNEVRTYVLARMRNPLTPGTKFKRPIGFDPVKHLGTSFGVWTGKGETIVELEISAEGSHHVTERHWHDTQHVTSLPGGAVKVTFALSDLNDVTRWILGFGGDIEVLKPAELRAVIAAEGKKSMAKNK